MDRFSILRRVVPMFSLPLFLCCILPWQVRAQHVVTGTVKDGAQEPLAGVTVAVKGSRAATSTDADGAFSIQAPEDATLVFSYLGFKTREVPVSSAGELNVVLEQDLDLLDEVVVVGYGTQRKRDFTGSVASADIEAFRESPNVNIMQSMQGSVPGVQVGQTNQADEEPSISIRGRTTLNGSTSPLIVVDGIIYRGRIGDLNPADIKSIDVLKDASSKAIYGAQAANGVILVTTRDGKAARKVTINYSGSYSIQQPTVDARLLNGEEVLQKIRDVEYRRAYLGPDYTQPNPDWDYSQSELLPRILGGIENGTNYDWWGNLTSPGHIMDHTLSVSGSSETTSYYISGGYADQEGFIMNDNYNRSTARINIETAITDWLSIGANTFGAFVDKSGAYPTMSTLARTSPFVLPVDENGEYIVNHLGDNIVNPFLNAQIDDEDLNNRVAGNFFGVVRIPWIEGLSYRFNYSNNIQWFSHSSSNRYGAGLTGSASKAHAFNRDLMIDNIVTYDRQLNDHGINVTLVAGMNKVKYTRTAAEGTNIPNLSLSYNSLQQAIIPSIASEAWKESSVYQMARVNYSYKSRYVLTGTLRRDGFSGFAQNRKTALFPSVGAAWVLSDEPFFDVAQVDLLKLRGSYGRNGNQTSRYSSLARVLSSESSQYVFGDGASTSLGQSPSTLANSDLSWESTAGLNVGLDFSVLKGRISGNFEFYRTTTTDLLYDVRLPQLTGFSSIKTNLGRIENTGYEFALLINPVRSGNFNWDLDLNFSSNKNKIAELLGEDRDGDGKEDDLVASGLFIGHSIGTVYGYEIDGIWQISDNIPEGFAPGTYRIVDQNGDGLATAADDRVILGRTEPAYRFGIQNTLTYKAFTFRFFINSIQGGRNGYLGANHPTGVATTSGTAQNSNWFNFYDYWSPVNPDGKYPLPWVSAQIRPSKYFSRSFVRLQDISLAYRLPASLTAKWKIDQLKIYVSGKNVFTFTDWDGWDPETGQGITSSDAFPVMRAFTLGLDISL